MSFTVQEILPNIYFFSFKSYRTMVRHFLRFQEYWENPVFKNKVFTLDEYREWYLSTHNEYDVEETWAGCAMSQSAFNPFYDGEFEPNERESAILNELKSNWGVTSSKKYFVITAVEGDKETLFHEIAHALYGTKSTYRKRVKEILNTALSAKTREVLNKHLVLMDYGKDRFDDETHAYLMEGITKFIALTGHRSDYTKQIKKECKRARKLLLENYKQHTEE